MAQGAFRCRVLVLCLAMGGAATSHATYAPQVGSASSSGPTPAAAEPDRSLDEVARSYCPRGLERFLPGSYYYCVARRELAQGHAARSVAALEQAARWGSKQAQFLLGVGYTRGDSAPLDRARGLAWLALAAERGDVVYLGVLKSAMAQASDEDKAEAARWYGQLLPTYGDEMAATRAERRYRRERDALTRNEAYGAQVCIDGLNASHLEAVQENGRDNNFCPSRQPVWLVARQVDVHAAELFQGWAGHVTVGELQKASRP
ncbi:SEL1-like repeat protein [Dyella solisilvae]|nr:SEL1-like repeat protein [Dyella solisilvae]